MGIKFPKFTRKPQFSYQSVSVKIKASLTKHKELFMKQFIFFVCLIIGISTIAIAQENETVPRFSLGGGLFLSSGGAMDTGGSADFALLIFHRNIWDIRNHLVFRGGNFSEGGIMMLSEKISFGCMVADEWRSYGYVEGGIGITAFEKPIAFSFGGGGGTDIFLNATTSIYFEAGGLFVVSDGKWDSSGIFQIGWKGWF
jgi:hypothetical protein